MNHLEQLAEVLGQRLLELGWVVGSAESCTGGMVAAAITDIAGSSAWFKEGLVTYANESKQGLLGVSEQQLTAGGAVSQGVVEAMASGVLSRGADMAIATSGIAGPGGGTESKPVGTVWFAWAVSGRIWSERVCFSGNRREVREQATEYALKVAADNLASTDLS